MELLSPLSTPTASGPLVRNTYPVIDLTAFTETLLGEPGPTSSAHEFIEFLANVVAMCFPKESPSVSRDLALAILNDPEFTKAALRNPDVTEEFLNRARTDKLLPLD